MDRKQESLESTRNKCAACFKQFNKMEHLVEHMRISYHSEHEPICQICKKHCRFFDSLREHLIGPLPKVECARVFSERGCILCLQIFDTPAEAAIHHSACQLLPAASPPAIAGRLSLVNKRIQPEKENSQGEPQANGPIQHRGSPPISEAVSLDCEMVGGGQDGTLDLCARVCLVDEDEILIFHTYVKPQLPVTDYRYDITGIKAEYLKDAVPLKQVQEKIQQILYNGEAIWRVRLKGGRAKVLVGHGLDHDLQCLAMEYPSHLIRDTSKYPPLLKSSKASNSLKYLTQTYLGYKIQHGLYHDPYENSVAAMRLYKKMRNLIHSSKEYQCATKGSAFASWKQTDLEKMTPDNLLQISQSDFYCWCADSTRPPPTI